jgi:hypothetical protein
MLSEHQPGKIRNIPRHVIVKILNIQNKKRILKAARGQSQAT